MNNTSLIELEKEKTKRLIDLKLDEDSINDFKSKIKKVDNVTKENLGKELWELVSKKKKSFKDTAAYEEYVNTLEDKVLELIINGADIEYSDEEKGDSPLIICIRRGFLNAAYVLLRAGCDVNHQNKYMTSPTMVAARHGYHELLEILIAMKADINLQCVDGDNALISAKLHGEQVCFDILVAAQAHLNSRNLVNKTFIELDGDINYNKDMFENIESVLPKKRESNIDPFSMLEEAKKELNMTRKIK